MVPVYNVRHTTVDKTLMPIIFPDTQLYNHDTKTVTFLAVDDKKMIACGVSLSALVRMDPTVQSAVKSFIAHRPAIEKIALKLIAEQRFEADGSVLITTLDC